NQPTRSQRQRFRSRFSRAPKCKYAAVQPLICAQSQQNRQCSIAPSVSVTCDEVGTFTRRHPRCSVRSTPTRVESNWQVSETFAQKPPESSYLTMSTSFPSSNRFSP